MVILIPVLGKYMNFEWVREKDIGLSTGALWSRTIGLEHKAPVQSKPYYKAYYVGFEDLVCQQNADPMTCRVATW